MLRRSLLFTLLVGVLASGCASISVKRYKTELNPETKQIEKVADGKGFEFPRADPYLLVKRTEADKKITDVQVVYLPDWAHTTEVKQRPFSMGATELGFTLDGPMLKSFNMKNDPKTEETLAGLTGLASGLGGLATAVGGAAGQIGGAFDSAAKFAAILDGIIGRYTGRGPAVAGFHTLNTVAILPEEDTPAWADNKEKKAIYLPLNAARNSMAQLKTALRPGGQQESAGRLNVELTELVDKRLELVCYTCADELRVLRRRIVEIVDKFNKELPKGGLSATADGGADGIRNDIEKVFEDALKAVDAVIGLLELQKLGPFELYKITPTALIPVKVDLTAAPQN